MTDWLWSIAFYTSVLFALVGVAGVIHPLRRVHRGRRKHALVMAAIGIAVAYAISWSMPRAHSSAEHRAIDTFTPAFHFRERHEITIAAPAWRVYEAIHSVTAGDIALFHTFTWIRRFGQPGPESIMNAPEHKPILDVATGTTFVLLHDDAREIVIGTIVGAPPGTRRPEPFGGAEFLQVTSRPGFAMAAMNFRMEERAAGSTMLTTETRVFATDRAALRRFTPYWRTIYPASAILRMTWLRAIKARAERPS